MITAEKIHANYKEFRNRIETLFPTRKVNLLKMYDDMENSTIFSPASSFDYFHNAFPGGYVDHVLRVHDFAILHYNLWKDNGLDVSGFTEEEMHFGALHHDLGKLGMPGEGNEHYISETSDWHRKNQGKMYKTNPNIPKMTTADRTFYLLQHYGVVYTWSEMIGIRCTDGLYDEGNGEYLKGFAIETKLRNPLPYILHHADMMAFRYEFDRWNAKESKLKTFIPIQKTLTESAQPKIEPSRGKFDLDLFASVFEKS